MKMKLLNQRIKEIQPCPIGAVALCCKNCMMGPCRLIGKTPRGACGADRELVMARNLMRMGAAGTSMHCGHALHILNYLKKPMPENYIEKKAPSYLQNLWRKLKIYPRKPFQEISEAFHQTAFGVDSDWQHVILSALKIGIVDGYYGLYLSTELEDRMLGKPKPKQGWLDLGVISNDKTNIAVHGHNPTLPAKIVQHKGDTNIVGVCCTGHELLARYGIPLAANLVFSEQVIATGAIEAMVVDVQCVMPSLVDVANCYHTKLITTHDIAHMPGATHIPFTKYNADINAKKIIQLAQENRKNRRSVNIPNTKTKIWTGWTPENMPITKLKDDLNSEKLKGVVAFIGCTNPRVDLNAWTNLAKKLIQDNYLVLTTGCIGYELGRRGLLTEKGKAYHLGSCVNNSRVAEVFKFLAKNKITDEKFLLSCPAPVSEKAISIGLFFTALGVSTHYGFSFLKTNAKVHDFLKTALKEDFQSKLFIEENPAKLWEEIKKGV